MQEKGIPFAYGTGAFPKATRIKMQDADVPFIPEVLATSMTSISREGFVKQAISASKKYYNTTHFDQIIAVGDGLWDLKAAQKVGVDFLGIGQKNKDVLIKNGCTHWVEDFKNFLVTL